MALDPHPTDANIEHLSRDAAYPYAARHKLSVDVIMLLPLPDGRFAVMNASRQIQGFLPPNATLVAAQAVRCPPKPTVRALGRQVVFPQEFDIKVVL